jgi:UDP-sulfoquinovose synthase
MVAFMKGDQMKVVVFGGDGFCGWPTVLHLSALGHDIVIVDNLARRAADLELRAASLTPIATLPERMAAWQEISGRRLQWRDLDVARDYEALRDLLAEVQPDAAIHLAEQRAAPYSMKSPRHKRYTVDNNVAATHNILCAIVDVGLDIHLVHIGSMGVYGYGAGGDAVIPEGYLTVEVRDGDGRIEREILHPTDPGSIYHMTKCLDQHLFYYYNKNDGVRVTDLHQGVVWGTNTTETRLDERLINRFDYDGDYGTVLNRFLMQAAIGHPLTVHGAGGQMRAFIHIQDTVRCLALALENPPTPGERVRIFNQMTETHRVADLARMIADMTGCDIHHVANPRNEAARNSLPAVAQCLVRLGLKPTRLQTGLMEEVMEVARRYAHRCDRERIRCTSQWRSAPGVAAPAGDALAV